MSLQGPASDTGRATAGRFRPGHSGNPSGKAKDAHLPLAERLDRMAEREAPAVLKKVLDLAKDGDVDAARLVLTYARRVA